MKSQSSHPLLLFSLLFIMSIFAFVSCRCPEHQKYALLNIFSDHSPMKSWRADGSDCCEWEGITCDHASGHVIGLDITGRYVSGPINSSVLPNLSSLRFLNLSQNLFGDTIIPSNLDCLSNLTHLNLSYSGFNGQIPVAVARMTNLLVLDLSKNEIEYYSLELQRPEVLLRKLSRLTKLHLDGVNISSNVPNFLSNCTSLTSLSLHDCELVGEFPSSIFQLPKLEFVDLSQNRRLRGSFPDFPKESALKTLMLYSTGFSGSLPDSFRNLNNLNKLDISYCRFSGSITSLGHLTELRYLNGSGNSFSGQMPSLVNLTRLAVLVLHHANLSSWIPPLDSLKSVTEIDLSSNNLNGEIPNFAGDALRNLELLDLSNNSLSGTVPLYLFTLPSIRALFLYDNKLDGELHEFANASSTLEQIYLSKNKLRGKIPTSMFGFRRLKQLHLEFNRFNGSLNFAMLPRSNSLYVLDLSHNSLVVNANVDTSPFPQMKHLGLGSCNIKQVPDFLKSQLNLAELDLSNNKIAGEIPSWIWNIGGGSLYHLNLSGNSLTSLQRPNHLSSNIYLRTVDLHSNQLQGEIPLPPSSIEIADYSKNNFTSILSSVFASPLGSLQFFSISGNNISGEIPASICNSDILEVLDLSDNSLSGSIPYCFGDFFDLEILNLKNNRLQGFIPDLSGEKCLLTTLNLNGNQLEGRLPESLSRCSDLEVLDVGNNRLTGPFPDFLKILSNLRVLVLRSNDFSGSINDLCGISAPVLQIIDMSSNKFSGTLSPNCFSGLHGLMAGEGDEDGDRQPEVIAYEGVFGEYYQDTVTVRTKRLELELIKITTIFKSLDLSNNELQGEIPKKIGALKLLRVLNMSQNYLMGQIPATIGNVRELESLDLSRNQISGRIPVEMNSLTFLEVLNLSYNQLVGSIPRGPQFLTFENDSFIGNPELCGLPLSRKCENLIAVVPDPAPEEKEEEGVNWLLISVQLGYTVGLAIVFGPLLLCKKWRIWFFKHADLMLAYLQWQWYYILSKFGMYC